MQEVRVATKAHSAVAGSQTAVQSEQKDPAVSELASTVRKEKESDDEEYEGSCGPLCEIARRQHLLDLDILYTVSKQQQIPAMSHTEPHISAFLNF